MLFEERMDAAGPVDAKTASTGPWKTAQTAVSHSAHTPSRFHEEDDINASHTEFLILPHGNIFALCSSATYLPDLSGGLQWRSRRLFKLVSSQLPRAAAVRSAICPALVKQAHL